LDVSLEDSNAAFATDPFAPAEIVDKDVVALSGLCNGGPLFYVDGLLIGEERDSEFFHQ
jgi:hypothetical protein